MPRPPRISRFLGRRLRLTPAPAPGEPPRLLLTEAEARKALSVSRRTLHILTKNGAIPHVRLGSEIRYSVTVLEQWIRREISPVPVSGSEKPMPSGGASPQR